MINIEIRLLIKWVALAVTLALAIDPRVMGISPVGLLKKRLLAACRKRLVCGFESLLCPFFHRFNFDPVPDRSFPDLTIFGVENSRVGPTVRGAASSTR